MDRGIREEATFPAHGEKLGMRFRSGISVQADPGFGIKEGLT